LSNTIFINSNKADHQYIEHALSSSELQFKQLWYISVDGMKLTGKDGKMLVICESFKKLQSSMTDELYVIIQLNNKLRISKEIHKI